MNVLGLIMLHNNGNIDKKFQPSILNKSRENQIKYVKLDTFQVK